MNCNPESLIAFAAFVLFQSLIGILMNCNGGSRKARLYLVFKVQLRGS
ncbi:MAG: hypothetical protein V7K72_09620 [Nostoc sp.]